MTDSTTTTTTAPGTWQAVTDAAELDSAPAPVFLTLPADVFAAAWAAVVTATGHKRDGRPVLCTVRLDVADDGAVTMLATDTYAMHRATIPAELTGSTVPGRFLAPAWKPADVARLCKGARVVTLTATGTGWDAVATLAAYGTDGVTVVGTLAAPAGADVDNYPATGDLFDRDGWPGDRLDVVGFRPALFARAMTAADRFLAGDGSPVVTVETMTPLKPARFGAVREDGATFAAVLMAHKLPTPATDPDPGVDQSA
jgi:hypothetical protein